MTFKQKISIETGIPEKNLPSSYQVIGNILLLKMPKIESWKQKQEIAEAVVKILPYVKTVCEIKEVGGEYREPDISVLIGDKTETMHMENRIKYNLDVAKIMFSKGNLNERKRIIPVVKEGETIVYMFA